MSLYLKLQQVLMRLRMRSYSQPTNQPTDMGENITSLVEVIKMGLYSKGGAEVYLVLLSWAGLFCSFAFWLFQTTWFIKATCFSSTSVRWMSHSVMLLLWDIASSRALPPSCTHTGREREKSNTVGNDACPRWTHHRMQFWEGLTRV